MKIRSLTTKRVASIAATLAVLTGCLNSPAVPELPSETNPSAVSDAITGSGGAALLSDMTMYPWDDGGRRAGDLLSWIPDDAQSPDRFVAERAGQSALAVATFLADKREALAEAPPNPILWQSFASSLVPYLGALVGDDDGSQGFEPLDALESIESPMTRTVGLFRAMMKNSEANETFIDAATKRANAYEEAFANAVSKDPRLAGTNDTRQWLIQAARLRGVVAKAESANTPDSGRPTPAHAQTQVAFDVAVLTARPGDPTIDPKFFGPDGWLIAPDELEELDWSIYDAQLTVYLSVFPPINDAIRSYGRIFHDIVVED
jgi:hypothetical protein